MQSQLALWSLGFGSGTSAVHGRLPAARKHQVPHRRSSAAKRGQLHLVNTRIQQSTNRAFGKAGLRQGESTNADGGTGAGLDLSSMLRNVFDFSTGKAPSAASTVTVAAATAVGTAAVAVNAPPAAATVPPVPPGPYAAAQMLAASSPISSSPGPQPLAALAEQVLAGDAALQDDPVAAARQLQLFLSQYRDQYGPETDARISAAVAKLQDYIDSYSRQAAGTGGLDVGGADAAAVGVMARGAAAGGGGEGEVYHNYILEQLTGVLDWVNNLLLNSNPKPYVFDAYGRVMSDPSAAATVEQQQEQLRAASNSLRVLIQQLQQVNRQYATMADPDEKAAMSQVLSQLTTMADRLAVAATRRPLPSQAPGGGGAAAAADAAASAAAAASDLSPYVPPDQVYGVDKYRDPLLRVLDGIYHAVVVDSGLREFLSGIKQLGDSLVSSMAVAWTGAPPIGRLIAYIAAVAGVLFVMRTRLPPALLAPTKLLGQLGVGSVGVGASLTPSRDGGGDDAATAAAAAQAVASGTPANPAAAAAFAAIAANGGSGDGQAAAAASAAAAAFAAIAANGANGGAGGGANPLAALDRDAGIGDTRLPSEILTSNDPYAARKALVDTEATPVSATPRRGGSSSVGLGNGWATLTGAASGSGAAASAPGSPELFTSPSFPTSSSSSSSLPTPPPGGWTAQYSDRADWWTIGQQQQQPQQQPPQQQQPQPPQQPAAAASPVPPSDPAASGGPRPRTVAESWDAFRRINNPTPIPPTTPTSNPIPSTPAGGVLGTTAALAAAAVAAAAASGVDDRKMAELARATEERRLSKDRARLRATIKDRLRWVCLALGPVSSVVPGGEPLRDEVDGLLAQLEALSPTDKPLNTVVDVARRPTIGEPTPLVDPLLLGDWRLVYASNASNSAGAPSAASQAAGGGPNLLAQLLHVADSLPGFGMTHVVQRLSLAPAGVVSASAGVSASSTIASPAGESGPGRRFTSSPSSAAASAASLSSSASLGGGAAAAVITTENSATFRFGPLGSWRVSVRGRWIDNGGGMCAAAEFESFSVRPVDLWGLPLEQLLPEVVVPVPDVLRSRSEWCTTYLDEEMRIGRGSGGALFLFKRGAGEAEPVVGMGMAGMATGQPLRPVAAPAGAAAAATTGGGVRVQDPIMRPL